MTPSMAHQRRVAAPVRYRSRPAPPVVIDSRQPRAPIDLRRQLQSSDPVDATVPKSSSDPSSGAAGDSDSAAAQLRYAERNARLTRWIARLTGVIVCVPYMGIGVGLLLNPEDYTPTTWPIALVAASILVLSGWWWERLGPWLALAGGALLSASAMVLGLPGANPTGGVGNVIGVLVSLLPFVLVALSYLVAARAAGHVARLREGAQS
jgi:hypothetical protein